MPTCEELQNEEAPHDISEHGIPDSAAALVAPLRDVQDVVPPIHPGSQHVAEGEGDDEGGGS